MVAVLAFSALMQSTARAGIFDDDETRKALIGSWVWDEGEGVSRRVTIYTFNESGTYSLTVDYPGLPEDMRANKRKTINGMWRLETKDKGLKSLVQTDNILILEYSVTEAGTGALVPTSSKYLVVISVDQTLGGKETLRLAPPDGALTGTSYYFRSE